MLLAGSCSHATTDPTLKSTLFWRHRSGASYVSSNGPCPAPRRESFPRRPHQGSPPPHIAPRSCLIPFNAEEREPITIA